MSPLFAELSRLALRYRDACESPLSSPRDREIIRTRMEDLEALAMALRSAARTTEVNDANRERLVQHLERMRRSRAAVRAARQPSANDEASEGAALLQDMETLCYYVKFLSDVIEHIPTKD